MTLDDILSPVWTLSVSGGGAAVEGIEAIKQCLMVIVRTTPGSDPFRPTFGCGIMKYVDMPLSIAIPNIKKAILDGVSRWETRVVITKITHTLGDAGQVIFNIGYTLADGTLADTLTVSVSSGGISSGAAKQRLILKAALPTSGTGLQYQLSGQINGSNILPAPPDVGFATISALFSWVQTNWLNYGQWYITGSNLVGYLNPGFVSGSVSVSLMSVRQISGAIPIGTNYTVVVSVDGTQYSNSSLSTPGDVLAYVQNDPVLGQIGTWQVASVGQDFNDDFSDDFNTYTQELQLITDSASDITISVTVGVDFGTDFNNDFH